MGLRVRAPLLPVWGPASLLLAPCASGKDRPCSCNLLLLVAGAGFFSGFRLRARQGLARKMSGA